MNGHRIFSISAHTARAATVLTLALALSSCSTSPTGRAQFAFLPDSVVNQLGVDAFNDMRRSRAEVDDGFVAAYVNCVANEVVAALPDSASQADWQVVVFADDSANAFALPGNRIGVHEGMLDVAQDQHQLAAVIGHEIAHVLARHANERMSTSIATQTGLTVASGALQDSATRPYVMAALGIGTQVGLALPYNRAREAEADIMGLEFMARAGFQPGASVVLWENMAAQSQGTRPPEFLSTHPSHSTRIAGLSHRLGEVRPLYED
ncbi:MAG: M48 family metallopeptidase, partial [Pseudomonadota bacterium]